MTSINFYDKERREIIELSQFQFRYDDILKQISFNLKIQFDFFNASTTIEAEENDFIELKEGLKRMYNFDQDTVFFSHLDKRFQIIFKQYDGQIEVNVEVLTLLFTAKLIFKYHIDQSFLPELISEIENMLKRNKMLD